MVRLSGWLGMGVLALLVPLLWFRPIRSPATGKAEPAVGFRAPEFALPVLGHPRPTALSHWRGKTVLLNFWTTWCPACQAEMPALQKVFQKEGPNVRVVTVNLTNQERSPATVERFVKQHGYRFPVLLDRTGGVSMTYRVRELPTTFFIGPHGTIRAEVIGPETAAMMQAHLAEASP